MDSLDENLRKDIYEVTKKYISDAPRAVTRNECILNAISHLNGMGIEVPETKVGWWVRDYTLELEISGNVLKTEEAVKRAGRGRLPPTPFRKKEILYYINQDQLRGWAREKCRGHDPYFSL